jgi:hypothetical protein
MAFASVWVDFNTSNTNYNVALGVIYYEFKYRNLAGNCADCPSVGVGNVPAGLSKLLKFRVSLLS